MKLIVGLGNPGKSYQFNRHNVGFLAVDLIAQKLNLNFQIKEKIGAIVKQGPCIIAKPLTFMNLSGWFVRKIVQFYQIPIDQILIIYDDFNLPLGQLKLKKNSSSGGHNGMQNIIDHLQTQSIARIKIGIGRPINKQPLKDYVLSNFNSTELIALKPNLEKVSALAIDFFEKSFEDLLAKKGR